MIRGVGRGGGKRDAQRNFSKNRNQKGHKRNGYNLELCMHSVVIIITFGRMFARCTFSWEPFVHSSMLPPIFCWGGVFGAHTLHTECIQTDRLSQIFASEFDFLNTHIHNYNFGIMTAIAENVVCCFHMQTARVMHFMLHYICAESERVREKERATEWF